ncbi:MAG: Crp/Fnr family transcriptional regulator [Acidobacteria bacterium]|nr:MAG: Crp/Fnr family transcriptional regulator [Acidobacteriota bacterium]
MQQNFSENRLLQRLGPQTIARIGPKIRRIRLEQSACLLEANSDFDRVYFPINSVISIVWLADGRPTVEVATIGNEGVLGLPAFLGVTQFPANANCQIPGDCYVLSVTAFRAELNRGQKLHRVLQLYTQALFTQVAQSAVCIRMHTVEQRACRWMLMCQDRIGTDRFPLTQAFLAQMLGVRRATVNGVARKLQAMNLIQYRSGIVEILDRGGLEKTSCECYEVVSTLYNDLFSTNHEAELV